MAAWRNLWDPYRKKVLNPGGGQGRGARGVVRRSQVLKGHWLHNNRRLGNSMRK